MSWIGAFSIFNSYEKMGVYPEEAMMFQKVKDEIIESLKNQYVFTEFIEVLGF